MNTGKTVRLFISDLYKRSSYKEHMVNSLAIGADEGRGKLR